MKLSVLALLGLSSTLLNAHHILPRAAKRDTEQREVQNLLQDTFKAVGEFDNWNETERLAYTASK